MSQGKFVLHFLFLFYDHVVGKIVILINCRGLLWLIMLGTYLMLIAKIRNFCSAHKKILISDRFVVKISPVMHVTVSSNPGSLPEMLAL